jgi:two-component system cell cycle response regulator DivK
LAATESNQVGDGIMQRILVVDDDPNSRKIVELMLLSQGYDLDFAENGREALTRAQTGPDLILLDVLMPIMNGHEAVRRLKADPQTADIPVVALTALAFESDRREALAAGCDGYLSKPFTRRELIAAVRQFLPDSAPSQALA